MTAPLWALHAVELAEMIRCRAVSCREAVTAALARLDAVNPRINAVVRPLHEEALAEATAADHVLARGGPVGPLHGVPITTEDLCLDAAAAIEARAPMATPIDPSAGA